MTIQLNHLHFQEFLRGYREGLRAYNTMVETEGGELESTPDIPDQPLGLGLTMATAREAQDFMAGNVRDLDRFCHEFGESYRRVGLLFALNKNGHGAGFQNYNGEAARALRSAAKTYGATTLLVSGGVLVSL
jgi:hypothetical protein